MATSPNSSHPTNRSFDQTVLAAYAAGETPGDTHAQMLIAAANEDMGTLAALLPAAQHDSVYHFARHVYHTKDRVPDRAALLPQIENDLRLAATTTPPLMLAKVRYLHRLLAAHGDFAALVNEIIAFPLGARDAELLAVVLHSGGKTEAAIALLSRILQMVTDAGEQRILATALVWLLKRNGKAEMAAQMQAMMPAAPHALLDAWRQPVAGDGDKATIIIPTNIGSKFVYNQASAPPSDAMIRQTMESLYGQLQAPRDWPVVIYFDEPKDPALQAEADAYRAALKQVALDYNASLECRPGHGLRRNFIEAVQGLDTAYYFFLEHDWTFSADAPALPLLLQTMQQQPDVNVIRYNYNFNHLQRHDYALVPYATHTGLPLLTGAYYCNNPALVRTRKMQRDWLPLLTNPEHDTLNGGAGGVEETIYLHMLRLVKECGILPVMDAMGCTVIGTPGNAPRAIHNGI